MSPQFLTIFSRFMKNRSAQSPDLFSPPCMIASLPSSASSTGPAIEQLVAFGLSPAADDPRPIMMTPDHRLLCDCYETLSLRDER